MFTKEEILENANKLGIKFDKFTLEDLIIGTNIELEHGKRNPHTNVTNDDILLTMKIALAHLLEFPDYYNKEYGLPNLEKELNSKRFIRFY